MKNKKYSISRYAFLSFFALFVLLPIVYTITNSFMSANEINRYYASIYQEGGSTMLHIILDRISLDGYYQMLFRRPDYLLKFWNSLGMTLVIVFGQVFISCLGGYAFAKFEFKFRDSIFFIIIILMMMPYQVTLVSNYIVLDKMGLIGSYWAVILPAIFSPFGVFLMRQVISTMPNELIEAAKLDGAGQLQLLFKIVVPRNMSGIISLVILSFIDNWNMVEQPLVFLKDQRQYPLSIFLAQSMSSNMSLSFACGVLAMIPVTLLFIFFEKELVEGISFSNLK
ncbi:MAG: carbohydrate ABC transporter permease [Oscillospiraceae bacterium]